MKKTSTQYGEVFSADFRKSTLTIKMEGDFTVVAGPVALVDKEEFRSILGFITEIQEALTDKEKGIVGDKTSFSKDEVINIVNALYSRLTTDSTYDGTFIDQFFEEVFANAKKSTKLSVLEFSMLNQANQILKKVK